jgi:predicted RNA-binding protein YlqC (UPF0109 family)
MKNFLEFIATHLVNRPESIRVDEEEKNGTIILRLDVDADERGKVIGKHGRTAQALRTLVIAVAARRGKRAILEIAR